MSKLKKYNKIRNSKSKSAGDVVPKLEDLPKLRKLYEVLYTAESTFNAMLHDEEFKKEYRSLYNNYTAKILESLDNTKWKLNNNLNVYVSGLEDIVGSLKSNGE
jgi:hypothetical protein